MPIENYAVEIDLPSHRRGDWWTGIKQIGPVSVDGSVPSDPLDRIKMHFTKRDGALFTLDSDSTTFPDAPIVISDATGWVANIPPVEKFLPVAGVWQWDMKFYSASFPNSIAFYYGEFNEIQDVSK